MSDSQVAQRDIESIIPKYEEFQAVFNVGFFMKLPDKEKRNFILNLTKKIDKEELFYKLGGKKSDIKKYQIDFSDNIKDRILTLGNNAKQSLEKAEIELRSLNYMDIPDDEIVDDVSPELIRAKDTLKKRLESKRKREQWKEQYNLIKDKIKKNDEIKKRIEELKVVGIEKPSRDKITKLEVEYEKLKTKIAIPKRQKCPVCFRNINDDVKKKIEGINQKNKIKANKLKEQIKKLQEKYNDEMVIYNADQDAKREIEYLKNQIQDVKLPEKPKYELINEKNLKNLREKIEKLEQIDIKNRIAKEKVLQAKQHNEKLDKIKKKLERIIEINSEKIIDLRRLYKIFSPDGIPAEEMRLKLKPIRNKFRKLIPTLEINTVKKMKDGLNTKEVFEITVDGKEYNKLSTGEKTKVDIAISVVIDNMLKQKIGIYFIDNAETLDSIPEITKEGQWFISKVSDKKFNLETYENKTD
ncbi:MAG TPA: hypothetical protein ENJ27_00990 [Candidatus Moranbacteria bacterium]|nr:hypothetical protein [Candidatus Moranbacteria bacterium]